MLRSTVVGLVLLALSADAEAQLTVINHVTGLDAPVAFVQDPTDRTIQYVVQQFGLIRVIRSGVVLATPFLDVSTEISTEPEQGLLGLAFAPDYATSGRFYVNFTNPAGHTVIARFTRSSDPLVANAGSRFDLRWGGPSDPAFIEHPDHFRNHNGGTLAFGPDGYLYIGLGDGGSGSDPNHRAQDPTYRLGKFLRIDVSVPDSNMSGYTVPADNPFVSGGPAGTLPDIWSFGWRNPWKFSFDLPSMGGTGALIVGDVGQALWEEIDYEPANTGGRNYGWRNREGMHDHVTTLPPAYTPLTDPIFELPHPVNAPDGSPDTSISIIGGYVYRGHALPANYRGRYFFGDLSGRVWSLALTINPMTGEATASNLINHTTEIGGGSITSWGMDADGELYIVTFNGVIRKVVGPAYLTGPAPADELPGPSANFTWIVRAGTTQIWLDVGTTLGGSDIYAASQGLGTSRTVSGLPLDGSRMYVRLWALTGTGWNYTDYTFTSHRIVPAGILSPSPGTTLPEPTNTFTWTAGVNVSQIWLDVGTTQGGAQIYGASQGTSLSRVVSGFPFSGSPIYLRLWSLTSAGWGFTDYTYTAPTPVPAGILSPSPGSTLSSTSVTFTWTAGRGVSQIWLDVGTTQGGSQIYGATQGTSTSRTVSGIPTGNVSIHVRLWSLTSVGWGFTDYTYTSP